MHDEIVRYLDTVGNTPAIDSPEYADWVEGRDALAFLRASTHGDVPVYVSLPHFYLYTVLVPLEQLIGDYRSNLLGWNFDESRGWHFGVGREWESNEPWGVVHEPLGYTGSSILDAGEAIVFLRQFAGRTPDPTYVELNQRIAHVAEVHFVGERNAYCRIDENGDIADVVRSHDFPDGHLCTVHASALDRYMFVSDQALVRVFYVERCVDWERWRWFEGQDSRDKQRIDEADLIAEYLRLQGPERVDGSTLRGVQVLRTIGDRKD